MSFLYSEMFELVHDAKNEATEIGVKMRQMEYFVDQMCLHLFDAKTQQRAFM